MTAGKGGARASGGASSTQVAPLSKMVLKVFGFDGWSVVVIRNLKVLLKYTLSMTSEMLTQNLEECHILSSSAGTFRDRPEGKVQNKYVEI